MFNSDKSKKTYYTDFFSFKRRPLNDIHQMLTWFLGEYTPAQKNDFETARGLLLEADKKMVETTV